MIRTAKKLYYYLYSRMVSRGGYNTSRLHYYEDIAENESLHKSFAFLHTTGERELLTDIPINFRNVSLESGITDLLAELGKPSFKMHKRYFHHYFNTLVYKQQFCGLSTRTIINLLNRTLLNCTYVIDITSPDILETVKSVIKQKYQLPALPLGNSFTLKDYLGNKLIFHYQFELRVTYLSTDLKIKKEMASILSKIELQKEAAHKKQMENLEFAF